MRSVIGWTALVAATVALIMVFTAIAPRCLPGERKLEIGGLLVEGCP